MGDHDCGADTILASLRAEFNALAFAVVVACLVDVLDNEAHVSGGGGEQCLEIGFGDGLAEV